MEGLTKPSITRLARRAGVKSLSDDCYHVIHNIVSDKLTSVIAAAIVVNSEHQTKTMMPDDIYDALRILGYNVAQSHELGTSTCKKK